MLTFGRVHPRIGRVGAIGLAMTALAVVHSAPAFAQVAAAPAAGAAATQDTQPQGRDDGDVVVTGSRVVRSGFSAPTPITVLSAEEIANQSPTNNLADFVNQQPALAGSTRPQNSRLNLSSGQAGINPAEPTQPRQFVDRHADAGADRRAPVGRIDRERHRRHQHHPPGPREKRRDRHRRCFRGLRVGCGRGRGQLHPRQEVHRPERSRRTTASPPMATAAITSASVTARNVVRRRSRPRPVQCRCCASGRYLLTVDRDLERDRVRPHHQPQLRGGQRRVRRNI